MGYYDQDYEDKNRSRSKDNFKKWFFSSLAGVILGALIVILSLPTILRSGILPYDLPNTTNEQGVVNNNHTPSKTVQVDVETSVTKAVEKASDAVVGIINIQQNGFWSKAGEAGTGSGVVYKRVDGNAFIVTNHHVIEGATELEVSLTDGTRVPARLLGSDIYTDLAVVQIDAKHVKKVAEFGSSEKLKVGEPAIAIGNPLGLQFSGSVTQGIISGLNRTIPLDFNNDGQPDWQAEVIQTDAAINPGNSGGALINIEGQVVGINSMKIAQQAVEGIGLSIPIETVAPIIDDLEKYGEVRRAYMGIGLRNLSEISSYHWQETLKLPGNVKEGVFIVNVVQNSPAAAAGLREMDVIVALDDKPIADAIDLRKHLYIDKEIGESMKVTFYRSGKKQTTTMKLTEEGTY